MENLIFNKYKILKTIPGGEKTSFYLVEDINTKTTLLLKQIKIDTSSDFYKPVIEEYKEKSKEPIKIDKKPSSPAILDFFMDDDYFYLVLEYKSERSLRIAVSYPSIGKIINNRYVIVNGIAAGGFGVVYLSRDLNLPGKQWAVKEMHQTEGIPLDVVERSFRIESQILAGLEHPNIPGISDFFVEDKKLYLVMDYIAGETVDKMIKNLKEHDYFPEDTVIIWALTVCDVLKYLHERPKPIIFRDLKPSNIMITNQGKLKLIDFGIAKIFQGSTSQVTQYALLTGGYAPPEQWLGKAEIKSDIYAFGATFFHIITRHHPRDFTPYFPPVEELNTSVSPALSKIIAKALELKPKDRFESIGEVKKELLNLQSVKKGFSHISMAGEYEDKGDFFSANFEYMKALDFDEKNYNILLSIARCFEKLGFSDRAFDVYHKILNLDIPEKVRNSILEICKPPAEDDDEVTVIKFKRPPDLNKQVSYIVPSRKQKKAPEESQIISEAPPLEPEEEIEKNEKNQFVPEIIEKPLEPEEEIEKNEKNQVASEIIEKPLEPEEKIEKIEDKDIPPVLFEDKKNDFMIKDKIQSIQEIKNEFFKLHSKKKSNDYIYKAREYQNRGDYFNANLEYVKALELDKENYELLLDIAMCCEKSGLKKKSLEYYNRLLKLNIPEKLRKEIQEKPGFIITDMEKEDGKGDNKKISNLQICNSEKEIDKSLLPENKTCPVNEFVPHIPVKDRTLPVELTEFVPHEKISVKDRTVPVELTEFVPHEKIPVKDRTVPVEPTEFVPHKNIPVKDRTLPVELTEFVPHEKIPVKDRTLPVELTEFHGEPFISYPSCHNVHDYYSELLYERDGSGCISFLLNKDSIKIGRLPENDLCLDYDLQVSSKHALITSQGKKYFIEDLGSTNKTYVNGMRVDVKTELTHSDEIKIGNIKFNFMEPQNSDKKDIFLSSEKIKFGKKLIYYREGKGDIVFFIDRPAVNIGRGPGNDICLDYDLQVSSKHALITSQGKKYFIEDLGSTNKTYVNGMKIDVKTELKENDEIKIGNINFKFSL